MIHQPPLQERFLPFKQSSHTRRAATGRGAHLRKASQKSQRPNPPTAFRKQGLGPNIPPDDLRGPVVPAPDRGPFLCGQLEASARCVHARASPRGGSNFRGSAFHLRVQGKRDRTDCGCDSAFPSEGKGMGQMCAVALPFPGSVEPLPMAPGSRGNCP